MCEITYFQNHLFPQIFTINSTLQRSQLIPGLSFQTISFTQNPTTRMKTRSSADPALSFFNNFFAFEGPNREYRKDFMTSSGNVTFTNNVVYGFDKGIWNSSPNLKVNNNCFWNVPTPISGTQPPLINSENLFADPMFVKDYGDFPDVDFHLRCTPRLIR